MNKRLVYIPVSHKDGFKMSANLTGDNKKGVEIYLKNAFVALKSVQKYNMEVDLALVVNFELSPYYNELFTHNNIKVYKIDFEDFKMPAGFTWSLAFFKITALKYITLNTSYEYTLQMESDEICISNFEDMWKELDSKILMIFSPFRLDHPNRILYSKIYYDIYKLDKDLIINKTGAGFIAGRKDKLVDFVNLCDDVYNYMRVKDFEVDINIGDEVYPSVYCALHPDRVSDANAYATVYWTGKFYYVSTNYMNDPVSIIHLPAEKQNGLIKIFNYYVRNKKLPKNKKIYRIMHFPKMPIVLNIKMKLKFLKSKILHVNKK